MYPEFSERIKEVLTEVVDKMTGEDRRKSFSVAISVLDKIMQNNSGYWFVSCQRHQRLTKSAETLKEVIQKHVDSNFSEDSERLFLLSLQDLFKKSWDPEEFINLFVCELHSALYRDEPELAQILSFKEKGAYIAVDISSDVLPPGLNSVNEKIKEEIGVVSWMYHGFGFGARDKEIFNRLLFGERAEDNVAKDHRADADCDSSAQGLGLRF